MRSLLNRVIVAVMVFGLGVTAVWHLSPYVQGETAKLSNLIASNITAGGYRLLGVAIVDSSGNHVSSFGEAGTVTAINAVTTAVQDLDAGLAPECDESVVISENASGNQQLIAGQSGQVIKVCDGLVIAEGTVVVQFVKGDDADCATSETDLTGAMSLKVDGTQPPGFKVPQFFMSAAADYLCIELSANVQVSGVLSYTQYAP